MNGIRQEPGRDFGVAGTYRGHETVDVVHEEGGRRTVTSLTPS